MYFHHPRAVPGALAALALVAAACGGGGGGGARQTPAPSSPSGAQQGMAMQPGAEQMHVRITSPRPGFVLHGNTLSVGVRASGYRLSCDHAGKPDVPRIGHYHVELDGSLVDMYCSPTARVSMQNLEPGRHMVEVVPAQDDHAEIHENAEEMSFVYRPTNPLPPITAASATGKPSIRILQPADGTELSGDFTVKVSISNFHSACGLLGKPDVAGYGHWHVNVDSMSGPMMGMGTMLGMACTKSFHGSTVGLKPGTTHTLFALLTDNGHAPLDVFDQIDFTVGG